MGERRLGVRDLVHRLSDRLKRAHPLAGYVSESDERKRLRGLPYTKAASDAADEVPNSQRIPFNHVAEHRRKRGV